MAVQEMNRKVRDISIKPFLTPTLQSLGESLRGFLFKMKLYWTCQKINNRERTVLSLPFQRRKNSNNRTFQKHVLRDLNRRLVEESLNLAHGNLPLERTFSEQLFSNSTAQRANISEINRLRLSRRALGWEKKGTQCFVLEE